MQLKDVVARQLLARRNARGMTQRQLAAAAKVHQSVICRAETRQTLPTLPNLLALARVLGPLHEPTPEDAPGPDAGPGATGDQP